MEVNGYGTWENVRIDSNTVASVYGKEHIRGTIKRAIKNDEVMYIDKNKSASFAQSVGVQFPESLSNGNSYVHSVFDLMPAVKSENAENHAEDAQDTANSEQTQAETPESEPNQENGEQKFSLKNESADKVDVDQMLRAGDSSMAGQTGTEEQTRHTPVDVTETMRQWADKRAGQIIREYRSAIDGESVREDMARLVNELAENGASSDALNATVNMAKGIIEKRYCRKYDDVCAHAHIPIHVSQGTTVGVRQRHDGRMISIHATCGRRPVDTTTLRKIARFQSTLPSRGATPLSHEAWRASTISIHAPLTGSDRFAEKTGKRIRHISIHAPLTGSDITALTEWLKAKEFQSTLPSRGATTPTRLRRLQSGYFNPRSPHGERQRH